MFCLAIERDGDGENGNVRGRERGGVMEVIGGTWRVGWCLDIWLRRYFASFIHDVGGRQLGRGFYLEFGHVTCNYWNIDVDRS